MISEGSCDTEDWKKLWGLVVSKFVTSFGNVYYEQAVSEETVSQGPSDSETADQNSTGESHQTENILHNAICLT